MHENFGRRRVTGVLALLASVIGLLGMTQAAQAGTVSKSGTTYTFTVTGGAADAATQNVQTYFCAPSASAGCAGGADAGNYFLIGENGVPPTAAAGSGCTAWAPNPSSWLQCPSAGVTAWSVVLGGNNDTYNVNQAYGTWAVPITVDAGSGNDNVITGNANDLIDGGVGSDSLNGVGGAGDRVDYSDRAAGNNVTVTFDNAANDGAPGAVATSDNAADNVQGMEGAIGGAGDDRFDATAAPGNSTAMDFTGGPGNDTLFGSNQNDTLRGSEGADTIDGNGGASDQAVYSEKTAGVTVVLGAANASGNATDGAKDTVTDTERVFGTAFDDLLIGDASNNDLDGGSGGNDSLQGRGGADTLIGGAGTDVADYAERATPLTARLDNVAGNHPDADVYNSIEGLRGGTGNDLLLGSDAADFIDGGPGDDTINGNAGVDQYFGGDGNDILTTNDGVAEPVDCGNGTDTANSDATDTRVGCELPSAGGGTGGGGTGGGGTGGGGTGGGGTTPQLKNMDVTVSYGYFPRFPKKTTKFFVFVAKNVPKGSKLVAQCRTAKGKKCKGKLGKGLTIRKTTKKQVKIKAFNKKYPAGLQLEVIVSKAGYRTKIKIVQVRKNKIPNIVTRCQTPGSAKRTSC